jgi:hypothetical protein
MNTSTIQLRNPETYHPRVQQEEEGLPASFANAPFVHVHYPHGWSYLDGHGFVPDLSEIVSKPGVNGVTIQGHGRNAVIDTSRAIAGSMKKGGRIIDPTDPRLGEFVNYVVYYPTTNGAKHFCFMGAEFEKLPGGSVTQLDTSDVHLRFRLHLRDAGLVEPMSRTVFNKLRDIAQKQANRHQTRAMNSPMAEAEYRRRVQRIAEIDAAWTAYQGAPAVHALGTAPAMAGGKLKIKATPAPPVPTGGANG